MRRYCSLITKYFQQKIAKAIDGANISLAVIWKSRIMTSQCKMSQGKHHKGTIHSLHNAPYR